MALSLRRRCAALTAMGALALGAATLIPGAAQAAVPSNDNFANAQVLSSSVSALAVNNSTGATTETGEPTTAYGEAIGATLWYRWTAPVTGDYAVSLAGSDSGLAVSVFTGSALSSLTRVAFAIPTYADAATGFHATAGSTYDIQVGGQVSSSTPAAGLVRLQIGAADITGTMTYVSPGSGPDPQIGCLFFATDNTFDNIVGGGCGSGPAGGSASYAVGLLPAGTYYVAGISSDGTGSPIFYGSGTTPTGALPLTIPGGGCTLSGFNVNFQSHTMTAPTGKSCPFAPACQQATGASQQTTTLLAPAKAAQTAATAKVAADQKAIAAIKKAIKKAKKKHKPTTKLMAKLARLTQQLKVDTATATAANTALAAATASASAAQAKVTAAC